MASEKDLYYAREAYKTVCAALDEMDWSYQKDEEKLMVSFGVNGDDIPITVGIVCNLDLQALQFISFLPFNAPSHRMAEIASAICVINYRLAIGSFALNLNDGTIMFRLGSCFRETLISAELVRSLIYLTCSTVDESNDNLFALCNGEMTLKDILQKYS